MKQFSLLLFILWSSIAAAQRDRVTVGLVGGLGVSSPRIGSSYFPQITGGFSIGPELQFRLFNRLHLFTRTEYQARIYYNKYPAAFKPGLQPMHLGMLQAGLQWKKPMWYAGAGVYSRLMLKQFFEPNPAICDCIGIVVFPPVKNDYSGKGFYFQAGFTHALSAGTNLLMELNFYRDFEMNSRGIYNRRISMPGFRVGTLRNL